MYRQSQSPLKATASFFSDCYHISSYVLYLLLSARAGVGAFETLLFENEVKTLA